MNITEKIKFQKTRDFGQKLNATFEFIRQNFKKLIGTLFRIAGIPLLILSLMWGAVYFVGFDMLDGSVLNSGMAGLLVLSALIGAIGLVFYQAAFFGAIYEYIMLYIRSDSDFTIGDVSREVRQNIGSHLVTVLALFAVVIVIVMVPMILIFLVAQDSPFMVFILGMTMMVLVVYIGVSLSLFVVIRVHEKLGVRSALGRSFDLIRGKWWSTFGLIFVCSLIQGAVGYLIFIPYYAIIFTMGLSGELDTLSQGIDGSVWFITISVIFYTLYIVLSLILSLLTYVAIAFQYYNLMEMKEAKGLLERMETFGQTHEDDEGHF